MSRYLYGYSRWQASHLLLFRRQLRALSVSHRISLPLSSMLTSAFSPPQHRPLLHPRLLLLRSLFNLQQIHPEVFLRPIKARWVGRVLVQREGCDVSEQDQAGDDGEDEGV